MVETEGKQCTGCREWKAYSDFWKDKSRRDGYASKCKVCKGAEIKNYQDGHRKEIADYQRRYQEEHRERLLVYYRDYNEMNRERRSLQKKEYREANKEKVAEQKHRYYEANTEKIATKDRAYREKNRERVLARGREYKRQNKEKIAAQNTVYREQNKEEIRIRQARYRQEHKEEIAQRKRAYRKRHPEVWRRNARKRRASKAGVVGSHTDEEFQALVDFYEVCPCCDEPYTKDDPVTEDHIVPLTWQDTSDAIWNIQPLHHSCNSRKGNRHATNYRDPVRELMAQPDKYGPESFMAAYWESATIAAPQLVTLEAH